MLFVDIISFLIIVGCGLVSAFVALFALLTIFPDDTAILLYYVRIPSCVSLALNVVSGKAFLILHWGWNASGTSSVLAVIYGCLALTSLVIFLLSVCCVREDNE